MCTYYKAFSKSSEIDTVNGIYLINTVNVIITDLRYTNVADFKAELARLKTNNEAVVVEIEFANKEDEEIEVYTEEQQNVYNKLQKLLLYKHYNSITCTDEVSCKMKLAYRPDKFLSLEKRVKVLENK